MFTGCVVTHGATPRVQVEGLDALVSTLARWDRGVQPVCVPLEHQYTEEALTGTGAAALKGRDRAIGSVLTLASERLAGDDQLELRVVSSQCTVGTRMRHVHMGHSGRDTRTVIRVYGRHLAIAGVLRRRSMWKVLPLRTAVERGRAPQRSLCLVRASRQIAGLRVCRDVGNCACLDVDVGNGACLVVCVTARLWHYRVK